MGIITMLMEGKYGRRKDGSLKGPGFLGELKNPQGGVSTELSMRYDDVLGGKEFPQLVPGLTQEEIEQVLAGKPSETAIEKAIQHAVQRSKQGLPLFKE